MKGWEMYHSTWILLALKSDLDFFFSSKGFGNSILERERGEKKKRIKILKCPDKSLKIHFYGRCVLDGFGRARHDRGAFLY